ncbi:MAG: 7TM-DISM domain-containing protein, partial [Clostridiales bacterium]|nr:7TM-DISM domain-containing protein [Clostridiales bacterium]
MKKEKLWIILFLFFSSIMCVAIFLVSGNTYSVAVESQNGVWDLREMDFDAYNVSLTGEVEYIPYALLSPEEFAESDNIIVGKIPNVPYLTSRVRLIVPENQHFNMAGYADDFGSNIFVNGVLLTSVGRPADNAEDNIPSERFIRFTAFSKDGEIEIIQQTSNFVFRSNTSHKNWIIGNQESVWRWVLTYTYVFIFNAGFFIALFFVHLLLFIILPRNKANLWFSLLCLALFIRTGIIFIRPMVVMLRLPWAFSLRTEYITMLCGLVLMTLACNIIFPGVLNKKFAHALYAISGAFLLVFIFASTYFASQTILHYHLLSCAWAAYVVIRIFISKPDFKQRIIFTGFIVVFIALVLDFLFYYMEPVLHSSVTEIAILILLMFQLTAMLLGTIEDAATLREAEHKLALENASLDRLNRLKTNMIATISH